MKGYNLKSAKLAAAWDKLMPTVFERRVVQLIKERRHRSDPDARRLMLVYMPSVGLYKGYLEFVDTHMPAHLCGSPFYSFVTFSQNSPATVTEARRLIAQMLGDIDDALAEQRVDNPGDGAAGVKKRWEIFHDR